MTNNQVSKIASEVKSAKRIVVFSHVNPDPDALGSTLGLARALKNIGKVVDVVNFSGVPAGLLEFPDAKLVSSELPKQAPDLIMVLDCGDIKRVGDSFVSFVANFPKVINIDHHSSNTEFGKINWVDTTSSSTCEMVYALVKELGVSFDPTLSNQLLMGIYGDTGSFRFPSTSPKVLRIAAELIEAGGRPEVAADFLYHNVRKVALKIKAELLSRMEFFFDGQVGQLCALKSDLEKFGAEIDDLEGIIDEVRAVAGVKVAVFIREDQDIWRVSLRSRNANYDVSSIAMAFGGGGHKPAAAFRSRLPLAEMQSKLHQLIAELLNRVK